MSLQDSGQYYHEVLKRIPPRERPAFEDEAMQERVWGRRWGVYDDVGPIRTVLVHRPADEIRIMTAEHDLPIVRACQIARLSRAAYYKPGVDRMAREACVVLLAGKAFLLGRGDDAAVLDQGGCAVVIKRRDAEDTHVAPRRGCR